MALLTTSRSKESGMQRPRQFLRRSSALIATLAAPMALTACDQASGQDDQATVADQALVSSDLTKVYANGSGSHQTFSSTGNVDVNNPFFQSLGTNGRSCVSCHQPAQAWGIAPSEVQQRFNASNGTDPIFRMNDGAREPNMPVMTITQRRAAYSMLLNHGVIRVGLAITATAEFDLTLVEDPYHFASATELSLFRRPLPSTNLKFLATVMWDGRESVPGNTVAQNLATQSNDATWATRRRP